MQHDGTVWWSHRKSDIGISWHDDLTYYVHRLKRRKPNRCKLHSVLLAHTLVTAATKVPSGKGPSDGPVPWYVALLIVSEFQMRKADIVCIKGVYTGSSLAVRMVGHAYSIEHC
jgi:hypothetical protein